MLQMTQKSPRIPQEKHKRVTLYIYRIREHFLQHINIEYSGQKNYQLTHHHPEMVMKYGR
jgi:hypothetical protein